RRGRCRSVHPVRGQQPGHDPDACASTAARLPVPRRRPATATCSARGRRGSPRRRRDRGAYAGRVRSARLRSSRPILTPGVVALLLIAGLSESAGRILPLISRRASTTRVLVPKPILFGLLITGGVIDSAIFLVWPAWASTLASRFASGSTPNPGVSWTAALAAPLILCA